jgi:Mg-chelatase subunit ChlI-like protein
LAPADLPKDDSGYGLGMAILAASGQIDQSVLDDSLFLGKLALDGSVRPIKGTATMAAAHQSLERLFVAADNATKAGMLATTKVFAISRLIELYRHLTGDQPLSPISTNLPPTSGTLSVPIIDFSVIYRQAQAKRAAEIAAAGGHNIFCFPEHVEPVKRFYPKQSWVYSQNPASKKWLGSVKSIAWLARAHTTVSRTTPYSFKCRSDWRRDSPATRRN